MKPMLARTYGPRYNSWPCYVQPKLNGVRALYQGQIFQSRDEKLWNNKVLSHLIEELQTLGSPIPILDGELYVHGWKLQRINAAIAVNRKEPTSDTPHVCFHVFDVVDPYRSFSNRWLDLYNLIQAVDLPHIKAVPTALVSDAADMQMHFELYTKLGYEGIMLRPDGLYEFGEHSAKSGPERMTQYRSRYLWKYKSWEDGEFMCVGVTQGEGKADIGIGALVLEIPNDTRDDFKVGTGFSDDERIAFRQNPPIGKLIKVRYLCLSDDGIPLNPSFLCIIE